MSCLWMLQRGHSGDVFGVDWYSFANFRCYLFKIDANILIPWRILTLPNPDYTILEARVVVSLIKTHFPPHPCVNNIYRKLSSPRWGKLVRVRVSQTTSI